MGLFSCREEGLQGLIGSIILETPIEILEALDIIGGAVVPSHGCIEVLNAQALELSTLTIKPHKVSSAEDIEPAKNFLAEAICFLCSPTH
jgi:hypothetical protein